MDDEVVATESDGGKDARCPYGGGDGKAAGPDGLPRWLPNFRPFPKTDGSGPSQ